MDFHGIPWNSMEVFHTGYHTCNATKVARETTGFFLFFVFFQSLAGRRERSIRIMSKPGKPSWEMQLNMNLRGECLIKTLYKKRTHQ